MNQPLQQRAGKNAGPTPGTTTYAISKRDLKAVKVDTASFVTLLEGVEGKIIVLPTAFQPIGFPPMYLAGTSDDPANDFTYQLYIQNATGQRIPLNSVPLIAPVDWDDAVNTPQPQLDTLLALTTLQPGEKLVLQRDAASLSAEATFLVETIEIGRKVAGQGTIGGDIKIIHETLSTQWTEVGPPPGKTWSGVPLVFLLGGVSNLSMNGLNFGDDALLETQLVDPDGKVYAPFPVPLLAGTGSTLGSLFEVNASIPNGWKQRFRIDTVNGPPNPTGPIEVWLAFREYDESEE
jgi:hypothetical protein